jgi:antitoxin HicB
MSAYPALFEAEREGGFTVTFPEAGIAATYGATWEAALAEAEDMLEEAVLGMIAHGEDVPRPAPVPKADRLRPAVRLPALTAAKLEAYLAMREAGLDAEQLAGRLGWQPVQVTRLFDGRHAVRLDQIEAILRALGRRLVVTSEAA